METETLTTPVPEGVPEQGSQATEPPAQADVQPQSETSAKVDGSDSQAPSQEETRSTPSQNWGSRKIRNLERQVAQILESNARLEQALQQRNASVSSPKARVSFDPKDPKGFWGDTETALKSLFDDLKDEIKSEIPKTYEQIEQQRQIAQSWQEAKNLIFTNETLKKDPNWRERLNDIIFDENFGLEEMSVREPLRSARLALALYEAKYAGQSRRSPASGTKEQMRSTATAVTQGVKPNVEAEFIKLGERLRSDPTLIGDPQYMEKFNALKAQLQKKQ